MKQTDRLHFIIKMLRLNSLTIHDLRKKIEIIYSTISLRQIQRDLLDIEKFLTNQEVIITFRINYLKYYKIQTNSIEESIIQDDFVIETNFYKQKLTDNHLGKFELIKNAIREAKYVLISNLINDETGDNFDFTTNNILFIPLRIINHRNTFYVGGYNDKKNIIQIFSITQLENVSVSKSFKIQQSLIDKLNDELSIRFGVTKNIDSQIYDIKIEISNVLGGFIKNHIWHSSQKFTKRDNNIILNLKCGINRELLGWLFQWMYNIKIIEPQILKDYYGKTIQEIQNNIVITNPLVYRNIFVEKEK